MCTITHAQRPRQSKPYARESQLKIILPFFIIMFSFYRSATFEFFFVFLMLYVFFCWFCLFRYFFFGVFSILIRSRFFYAFWSYSYCTFYSWAVCARFGHIRIYKERKTTNRHLPSHRHKRTNALGMKRNKTNLIRSIHYYYKLTLYTLKTGRKRKSTKKNYDDIVGWLSCLQFRFTMHSKWWWWSWT